MNEQFEQSKTQRKKELQQLNALGAALVKLSAKDLTHIPLDDLLKDSIQQAKKINSNSARKRQIQYIAKLLRQSELDAIKNAYERLIHPNDQEKLKFKRLEQLRDILLSEGDSAINKVIEAHPQTDRQHLRQLLRAAIHEQQNQEHTSTQQRKLFRYLRTVIES